MKTPYNRSITTAPQSIRTLCGIALLSMVLIGFSVRVYLLAAQSLWYDEAVSWYLTQMSLPQLTTWTAHDIQPPLYYYLLWLWVRLVGTSEYALRFPSVLFATLTLPLLWQFARRLLGTAGAWLTLLLALLSPFHVYYAQEARMYTLLTLLGLLSTCLWLRLLRALYRAAPTPYHGLLSAIGYAITMAAALYTHYFAAFLFAAHLIAWAWIGWRHALSRSGERSGGAPRPSPTRAPFISIAVAALLVLVLYSPWLPFLIGRYAQDTSYWPGRLSIVEMARRLFLTFTMGETVKEAIAMQLAPGHGIILLISVAALLWAGRSVVRAAIPPRHKGDKSSASESVASERPPADSDRFSRRAALPLLLSCLIVPVALVLFLAWQVPKFNPRYAMLAWPAFVVILAGGLAVLIKGKPTNGIGKKWLPRCVGILAAAFVLSTSLYSLHNWFLPYRDNQFNKADFRITAQIVRERIKPDETVLLSSGHMAPAWAYYYGWEGWHPLPAIETLDVGAILDLSVGDRLAHILAHKRGVWLVRWQNEITDPFDVLPLWLSTVGEQDDYGQFWHMELYHYRLPSQMRFDLEHVITHPVRALVGGQIRLLGMRPRLQQCDSPLRISGVHGDGQRCMALALVWQAVAQVEEDYAVFVHLRDGAGIAVANGDHLPARPTSAWPIERAFPDQISLKLPPEMPDGSYWLEVGLYHPHLPELPRLGPVMLEPSGELQPGERVLVPIRVQGGQVG